MPLLLCPDQWNQAEPLEKRNLDSIKRLFRFQQIDHRLLKEGTVHAKLQNHPATDAGSQVRNKFPQERHRTFRIMNITGPVLQLKNVTGLCQMGQQGIIRTMLSMMGIEATKSPRYLAPVVMTVPSTSSVNRLSSFLSIASHTIWLFSSTKA
jgi:hypothetical protein